MTPREGGGEICGFCGQPGADKVPHPVRWPGEDSAGTDYVHASCESGMGWRGVNPPSPS